MLVTPGKFLKSRLFSTIRESDDLSPRQLGFRVGRSMVNTIQEAIKTVRKTENYSQRSQRVVLALEHAFRVPKYLLKIISDYLCTAPCFMKPSEGS